MGRRGRRTEQEPLLWSDLPSAPGRVDKQKTETIKPHEPAKRSRHARDLDPEDEIDQRLMTVPQAAKSLSISVRTCWRLIAAGELARVNIGRCVRVNKRSVQQLIKRGGTR